MPNEALLYERAPHRLAAQALSEAAVRHAAAAKDFTFAADQLSSAAKPGGRRAVSPYCGLPLFVLPDSVKQDRPHLLLAHAWADFLTDTSLALVDARLRKAELCIERLVTAGTLASEHSEDLQGVAAAIRAAQQSKEEAAAQTIAYAQQALALLPMQNARWRSVALRLGLAYEMDGAVRPAIATLEAALQLCRRIGNEYSATVGSMALACTLLAHGQLRTAEAIYSTALEGAQQRGMG